MRHLIAPLLLVLATATPAAAQSVYERAAGIYGDASDPALSCQNNPHELSFTAAPPHAVLQWNLPQTMPNGRLEDSARYDLLGADATTLTLRREGDPTRTETGARPIWLLRLTDQPLGYCWGRTDWPLIRCEQQQLRCDADKPVS
jgi:hypothetical protein